MAPTFVNSGTTVSGGGGTTMTASPPLPPLAAAGHIVVAYGFWANRNAAGDVTPTQPGWTEIFKDIYNPIGTTVGDGVLWAYWAEWTPSLAPPGFLMTNGFSVASYIARCTAWSGVHLSSPIDSMGSGFESTVAANTVQVPSITTLTPNTTVLIFAAKFAQSTGGISISPPASLLMSQQTLSGDDATMVAYSKDVAAAGPVGVSNVSMLTTTAHVLGRQIALREASTDQIVAPPLVASTSQIFVPAVANVADLIVAPSLVASTSQVFAPVVGGFIAPARVESTSQVFAPTLTVQAPGGGGVVEPMTLQRFSADVFPPGTSVSIHEAHRAMVDRAPSGAALSVEIVDSLGRFSASGLTDRKWYVAYAQVVGNHRYLRFRYEASPE